MNEDASIGRNLATLRTAASLSQGDLAERIGVAQQTIAKIEKGTRPLKYSEAVTICAELTVPIAALSADVSKVDSTASLLRIMNRLLDFDSKLAALVAEVVPDLVRLAFKVSAIKDGRLDPPSDWDSEGARAMSFVETDWGVDHLNWLLTNGVRRRCFDLGFLSEVDADSYLEILSNAARLEIPAEEPRAPDGSDS